MKRANRLLKIISKKNIIKIFEICVGLILSVGVIIIIHDALRSFKRGGIENLEGGPPGGLGGLGGPGGPDGPGGPGGGPINKEDDDRYMLKSETVPPVCPKCPDSSVCPKQEECPPCPACERCPEPSFTCKKVPNYQSNALENSNSLPLGYLNSFEQF